MIKNFFKNHKIHKKIAPYMDYVFLFKPINFFLIWVLVCIGMYIAQVQVNLYPQWQSNFDYKVCLFFFSLTLILGSVFIKEEILKSKEENDNNRLINSSFIIKIQKWSLVVGFLLLLPINLFNLFLVAIIYLLFEKFNFNNDDNSNQPLIFYLLIPFILILNGYCLVAANNSFFMIDINLISIIKIFIYTLSTSAISLIIYGQYDKQKINYFSLYSMLVMSVCFILGIYLVEPLLSICTIVSIPFFLYASIRRLDKDVVRAIRYPVFIFNFFLSTIYPYLALILIIVFYISKYYNWHRHNIHYPTFLINND